MLTPIRKPAIFTGSYINHVDSDHDAAGNEFVLAAVQVERDGKNTVDAVIKRKIWGTGVWETIYTFKDPEYGKNGYGSINVVGPHVIVYLPLKQPGSTTVEVVPFHFINIASALERTY